MSGGKTYYLRVTVTDAAGNSAKSSTKNQAITKVYYWDRYTAVAATGYSYSWTSGSSKSSILVGCYYPCNSTYSNIHTCLGVSKSMCTFSDGTVSFSSNMSLNYNTFKNWNGCLNGYYTWNKLTMNSYCCFIIGEYLIINGYSVSNSCYCIGGGACTLVWQGFSMVGQGYTATETTSTVYSKGTYVTSVQTTSSTTYTSGTVNSDGYWYVYTGSN